MQEKIVTKLIACGLYAAAAGVAAFVAAEPVDLASGIHVMTATDLTVQGTRGTIGIQRVYRSQASFNGTFGTERS